MSCWVLFFLFAVASALAPLHTAKEPRMRNGLGEYIVLLSDDAPRFGRHLEKLRNWMKQDLSLVDAERVKEIWSIGNFSAFPALLSPEGVHELRQHSYVKLIEEVQRMWIDPMERDTTNVEVSTGAAFTTRKDWGQMRAQQITRNLDTNPPDLYTETELEFYGYPDGEAPTENWDWDGPVWNTPNDGNYGFVWVIDTGINYLHQEFRDPITNAARVTVSVDCTGDDNEECESTTALDFDGHGSHCAGTCCGTYRGMAPGAGIGNIVIYNEEEGGFSTWTLRGLQYAFDHQVSGKMNIASLSGGGPYDEVLNEATAALAEEGFLMVVAAGNEGDNSCDYSPSSAQGVITVGATDALDTRADFSNYGDCTTIMAPGVQIHSAWKTEDPQNPNVYNTIDGTSMATPIVSGSLAVLATRSPNANAAYLKTVLYWYSTPGIVNDVDSKFNRFINARFSKSLEEEKLAAALSRNTTKQRRPLQQPNVHDSNERMSNLMIY